MNKIFEQNFVSNQNGTDKVNSISKNFTKIRSVLIFTGCLMFHTRIKGVLEHIYFRNDHGGCAYWSRCAK